MAQRPNRPLSTTFAGWKKAFPVHGSWDECAWNTTFYQREVEWVNELGEFSKYDLKTSLLFNFSIDQVDTHANSFGMNPLWLHIPTHKPLDLAMVDHTSRVGRPKHRKRKPSKHGMIWINLSVPGSTLFASYWNSDIFSIQLGTDPPASVHSVSLPDFLQTLQHLGSLKTIPTWSH